MKPAYNLQPFIFLFFYSGKVGFLCKRVLWKSKCFSGLQTNLWENMERIGIYDPKAKLLISVGKYVLKRRLWKRSCIFHSDFFLGVGCRRGIFTVNVERWSIF